MVVRELHALNILYPYMIHNFTNNNKNKWKTVFFSFEDSLSIEKKEEDCFLIEDIVLLLLFFLAIFYDK